MLYQWDCSLKHQVLYCQCVAEINERRNKKQEFFFITPLTCSSIYFFISSVLSPLTLAHQGELTMTSDMENLQNAIFLDMVPESWTKRAYPSMSGLALWFTDLLARIRELEAWSADFSLPSAVWLAGFFNPQSFLTAIMQAMARR